MYTSFQEETQFSILITLMSQLYYILSLWFLRVKMIFYSKKYNMTSQQGLILQSDKFNDLLYICEIILPLNFVQHDVYMCCMFDSLCVCACE